MSNESRGFFKRWKEEKMTKTILIYYWKNVFFLNVKFCYQIFIMKKFHREFNKKISKDLNTKWEKRVKNQKEKSFSRKCFSLDIFNTLWRMLIDAIYFWTQIFTNFTVHMNWKRALAKITSKAVYNKKNRINKLINTIFKVWEPLFFIVY